MKAVKRIMDKAWKKTERMIASRLKGRRVPVTGRQRGDAPDVAHDWLSIECKHRQEIPHWLREALAQATASAAGTDKLPVAIIHESGKRHDSDLVVMTLAQFESWFGQAGAPAGENPNGIGNKGVNDAHQCGIETLQ